MHSLQRVALSGTVERQYGQSLVVGPVSGACLLFRLLYAFYHQKYGKGDDEEIYNVIDELSVGDDGYAFVLGFGQRGGDALCLVKNIEQARKSTCPSSSPIGGMKIPSTSEVTILPKAAPITTATARSITLPRAMNSLNSLNMFGNMPSTSGRWVERLELYCKRCLRSS